MNKSKRLPTKYINKLIQGNVIEVLNKIPDNTIDLIITSPPYNKRNSHNGWLVTNETYSHYDDHLPEIEYQDWQVEVLDELYRITKPGGSLFYNHKHRWIDGLLITPFDWLSRTSWTIKQEVVWDRALTANMRGWRYWQVDERIYWLYKPIDQYYIGKELKPKHAKLSSIWRIKPAPRSDRHPAAFPIDLPTRIIYSILINKKGIVLDPFCGTGTTLVAAKLLGHKYVGIDISPNYIDIAKKRLAKSKSELSAVNDEKRKHKVNDPFAKRKERGTVSWPFGPKKQENQDKQEDDKKVVDKPLVKKKK